MHCATNLGLEMNNLIRHYFPFSPSIGFLLAVRFTRAVLIGLIRIDVDMIQAIGFHDMARCTRPFAYLRRDYCCYLIVGVLGDTFHC